MLYIVLTVSACNALQSLYYKCHKSKFIYPRNCMISIFFSVLFLFHLTTLNNDSKLRNTHCKYTHFFFFFLNQSLNVIWTSYLSSTKNYICKFIFVHYNRIIVFYILVSLPNKISWFTSGWPKYKQICPLIKELNKLSTLFYSYCLHSLMFELF